MAGAKPYFRGPLMSRIPASAGVVLAGLLPAYAAALGLGEVESKSFLNQPFAAEIPVFTDVPDELAGLSVSLASADTFARYGLQQPGFLGDLSFVVAPAARGAVIRISSTRPVAEPFVTLLLELQWSQGRLLREYTVLLDPPTFTGSAVRQPVQAPAAAPAPTPARTQAPATEPAAAEPAGVAGPGDDNLHTVIRNETLWSIAEHYRTPDAADINQIMMAIYRANPEAFAGNINRLNAGAVLRIPDQAAVAAVGRGEAGEEVRQQTRAWQETAQPGTAARLELVPPAAEVAQSPPAATTGTNPQLTAEMEESRRLLAVKDAELQALRKRVTELEKQGGGTTVEPLPPAPEAAVVEEPLVEEAPAEAPVAEVPAAADQPAAPAKPVRTRPPKTVQPPAEGGGIVASIGQLLTSIWLWIAAAVVLVGALLLARRRSAAERPEPWQPTTGRGSRGEGKADATSSHGDSMVVIEEPPLATGSFERPERRDRSRDAEESALEKTFSADSPVNIDQADPLAEAEFHVAYGLYDQAAGILATAIAREPTRRDLQLKLLDVYFGWENREGFLKEARALRTRIGTDADPDWKRVCIMGKQLWPGEALFASAAAPAAEDMDFALDDEGAGHAGTATGSDTGLDFDLSGVEFDGDAATQLARPFGSAQTQEIPTIEAPGPGLASTMETPTIESPDLASSLSSTMETPTIQTRAAGRTMETPTIEAPDLGGTARLRSFADGDDHHDETAEIDLEDLGLDLTGLEEAARDMATGLQDALPDDSGIDFDLSDATTAGDGEESTAEMAGSPTLNEITNAMDRLDSGLDVPLIDDTAEQPGISQSSDTMATQRLSATSDELESLEIDLDMDLSAGDVAGSDLTATGLRAIGGRRPEDPTMTEVGTKLDLARAYLDMGDPDGARSILNEVIEEGDPGQRQEARQLLDSIDQ